MQRGTHDVAATSFACMQPCRAEELVKILMHAFDTDSGIPYGQINLQTQKGKCVRPVAWPRSSTLLCA